MPLIKEDKLKRNMRARLRHYADLNNFRCEELAKAVNLTPRTYYERLKNPYTFEISELVLLSQKFGIPIQTFFEPIV